MMFRGGEVTSFSRKQMLNAKCSAEAELIGVDIALPQIMWTHYFLEAQDYTVKQNILHKNQSAMIMKTKGKNASSKQTKHIKVRYFLSKIERNKNKSNWPTVLPTKCGMIY